MRGFWRLRLPSIMKTTDAQLASDNMTLVRSFAVSTPRDSQSPRKGNKKISREMRLAMVEEFVKNYRSANAGKFPSVKSTNKEVGGSYYVIRYLVQQLIHESESPSVKKSNEFVSIKTVTNTNSHHEKSAASTVDSKVVSSFRRSGVSSEQPSASEKKYSNINPMLENCVSAKVAPTGGRSSNGDQDLACDQNNNSATSSTRISKVTDRFPETSATQDGSSSSSVCITNDHPRSKENISEDNRNTKKFADAAESLPKEQRTVWDSLKSFAGGILGRWRELR